MYLHPTYKRRVSLQRCTLQNKIFFLSHWVSECILHTKSDYVRNRVYLHMFLRFFATHPIHPTPPDLEPDKQPFFLSPPPLPLFRNEKLPSFISFSLSLKRCLGALGSQHSICSCPQRARFTNERRRWCTHGTFFAPKKFLCAVGKGIIFKWFLRAPRTVPVL